MEFEWEQMSDSELIDHSTEIKTLKDVRRYDKKTLVCPGGCEAQLQLHEIAKHECIKYLKEQLAQMDDHANELESRVAEMVAMEAYYKTNLASLESKIEDMSEELRVLMLERTRRDEIFCNKETFYKEQTAALKEQVSRLEKRLQETARTKRPSQDGDDDVEGDIHRIEKDWALRYDKLLAEKITIETLYQRKEREYQHDMNAMKQEVCALRDSLRLEREVMALEFDQANFDKLQSLIDQLEDLVRQKKDVVKQDQQDDYCNNNNNNNQGDEDYVGESRKERSHAKLRQPDSIGHLESYNELIIEPHY